MAKVPTITVPLNVQDLTVADVLEWLCRKADEENRAHAEGHREHAPYYVERRAEKLPKLIQELQSMHFDIR